MNRVLARQLRRLGLSATELPQDPAAWGAFLERIEASYRDADRARYLLERSTEISAREMQQLADDMRELSRREVERKEQLSQHNFNELPVAAWVEDFSLVVERLEELRATGVEDLTGHLDEDPDELRALVGRVVMLDCNPAVCELVGATREELLGRVDGAHLGPESLRSWQRQFEAIWDGVGRVEVEFTGQRADRSEFSALLQWSVAQIEGTFDYSRVMVVVIDISDRIAEEERMRQLVKAKDEFLASVSHELRTPLTSVVGYAQLLAAVGEGSDEHRDMIETIAAQASDLANIVEDLLVGARVELGQLTIESGRIDVAAVVRSVMVSFPGVRWDGGSSSGAIAEADPARVRQILRNLVTNAERYGGADVEVTIESSAGSVVLDVSDGGAALEPEIADKIFDRYYRRREPSGRPGSVGIGLTISRELARLMGGDLTYRHDGGRAHFELMLPVAARAGLHAVG